MLRLYSPQAIQDVDEFVSSSEEIWRNVAVHHLLTNGSYEVNGCRQNESPNSWQEVSNLKWFLLAIIRLKGLVVSSESGEICINQACENSPIQFWTNVSLSVKRPSFVICCFLQKKILLHMVKNFLWKCNLYIFNIDWVRSHTRLKL